MQIVPQILSYRYKNERSVAFKIRQNPFSAGAVRRTPLGELTTLLQTPLSAGKGTPLPIPHPTRHGPTFVARHASPQKSSQIYAYVSEASDVVEICRARTADQVSADSGTCRHTVTGCRFTCSRYVRRPHTPGSAGSSDVRCLNVCGQTWVLIGRLQPRCVLQRGPR